MPTRRPNLETLVLLAILAGAAMLRLYKIDQPLIDAFSWRETSTAMMAGNFYRTDPNILFPEVDWTGPGPNYQAREFQTLTYLASLGFRVVGQQDWVGRLLAVIFGVWGVFALHQLVRRVWDRPRALAAAAVMAVLPGSIFIERSFLPDPAMVSIMVTAMWLWVEYLRAPRVRMLVLAMAVLAWGLATKLPGLVLLVPMGYAAGAILGRRELSRPRTLLTLAAALVAALAPVVAYYVWIRHLALSYPPHHFAGEGNWVWEQGVRRWIAEEWYYLPRLWDRAWTWLWGPGALVLWVVGLFLPQPPRRPYVPAPPDAAAPPADERLAPRLFHWWLAGFLILWIIGARELVGNPWNLHIVNPAVAALCGHAVVTIRLAWAFDSPTNALAALFGNAIVTRRTRARERWRVMPVPAVAAILVLGVLVTGARGLRWMYHPYAEQSLKMGLALRELSQPTDLVVTLANTVGDPVAIYYSRRRGWVFPPSKRHFNWGAYPPSDTAAIAMLEELRGKGAVWFGVVQSQEKPLREQLPEFVSHLEQTADVTSRDSAWIIYRLHPPQRETSAKVVAD